MCLKKATPLRWLFSDKYLLGSAAVERCSATSRYSRYAVAGYYRG